jgi:hypothetical protein
MLYPAQARIQSKRNHTSGEVYRQEAPRRVFRASLKASSTNMLLSHEPWEIFNLAASIRAIGAPTQYFRFVANRNATGAGGLRGS